MEPLRSDVELRCALIKRLEQKIRSSFQDGTRATSMCARDVAGTFCLFANSAAQDFYVRVCIVNTYFPAPHCTPHNFILARKK